MAVLAENSVWRKGLEPDMGHACSAFVGDTVNQLRLEANLPATGR